MAAVGDVDAKKKIYDNLREILREAKENQVVLRHRTNARCHEMNVLRFKLNQLRNLLKDKTIADIVKDYSPFDVLDSAEGFIGEVFKAYKKTLQIINQKVDELETCLKKEYSVLLSEGDSYFREYASEFNNLLRSMTALEKSYDENKDLDLYKRMLLDIEKTCSEKD